MALNMNNIQYPISQVNKFNTLLEEINNSSLTSGNGRTTSTVHSEL